MIKNLMLFMAMFLASTPKNSSAQKGEMVLTFDKKFIECEDKWVALMNKDKTLSYGFVYIDPVAGLTLDVAGSFKVESNVFIPSKRENSSTKVRIPVTNTLVAIIPSTRFKELGVNEVPDWLKSYKENVSPASIFYRKGFIYNGWNQCEAALPYLEKAKAIDPNFKGLKAEFAFAYNALKQYDKAVVVLEDALKENQNDCYLHKELVYAHMNLGLADKAKASAIDGIAKCNNNGLKGEMAYNITFQYFKLKDKDQFATWATETEKWVKPDHQFIKSIAEMKTKLDK